MTEGRCDYCWRPSVTTIYLRRGPVRVLLRRPRRERRVCLDHLCANTRPGGRHA